MLFPHIQKTPADFEMLYSPRGLECTRFASSPTGYLHVGNLFGALTDYMVARLSKGLANAVILPVVLEEYGSAVYKRLSQLADIVGIAGVSEADKAVKFISAIKGMNERMNIPKGFAQIQEADIDTIVERAMKEAHPLYPTPVIFDKERLCAIVRKLKIEE